MGYDFKVAVLVYGGICLMGVSGCATFKSLDVAAHLPLYERILIYSGTVNLF